jgi:hypothetical protein
VTLLQQVPLSDEDRRKLDARDVCVVEGRITELMIEEERLTEEGKRGLMRQSVTLAWPGVLVGA